jgi:hypothetical protein
MWSAGTNGPKVATVAKMKEPMGVVPGANRKEDFPQQSDVSAEQLGSQTIDNVMGDWRADDDSNSGGAHRGTTCRLWIRTRCGHRTR